MSGQCLSHLGLAQTYFHNEKEKNAKAKGFLNKMTQSSEATMSLLVKITLALSERSLSPICWRIWKQGSLRKTATV